MPVLARPVASGETIQPYHLEVARVRARSGRAKALPASMLTGAVAARDLPAGMPITESDVHRPTVVQLNDTLMLEVRKGAVVARTSATALGSASIGDRVRVRALLGGQEHSAVVVSRDLVRIDLGG
jgi:flagella basal body P-ring formation protein FlgA